MVILEWLNKNLPWFVPLAYLMYKDWRARVKEKNASSLHKKKRSKRK